MTSKVKSWVESIMARFRRESEEDFDRELQFHIEQLVEDHLRSGISREEARRRALIELGSIEQTKEECRDALGMRLLSELLQDLRYGVRQLRRGPGFTAVAVLTLALGIGANIAIFSVIQAVLLRPLPYPDPDRIMCLEGQVLDTGNVELWRQSTHSYQRFAAMAIGVGLVRGGRDPMRIRTYEVSADFFPLLGVQPARGRAFADSDFQADSQEVILISDRLWQEMFGSDPAVTGRTIDFEGRPRLVIGSIPPH